MFDFNKSHNSYNDRNQLIDETPDEMYNIPIHDVLAADSKPRRYCRIVGNIILILGVALVIISALFKLQSRVYISEAVEADCPVSCVTTCYSRIPFPKYCDFKPVCDEQCLSVGIQTANTYAILFTSFVSLGGLLVLVQVIQSCIGYCCFDYVAFKNKQGQN